MKLRQEDCETLVNIARLKGYEVKAGHISLKEGYDVIKGAIIMFMMAFNLPAEACDVVASLMFDVFSYIIENTEDNE